MNDVDAEQGKAAHKQRQHRTMDGTGQRGPNSQRFPIDSEIHEPANVQNCNFVANFIFM